MPLAVSVLNTHTHTHMMASDSSVPRSSSDDRARGRAIRGEKRDVFFRCWCLFERLRLVRECIGVCVCVRVLRSLRLSNSIHLFVCLFALDAAVRLGACLHGRG